MHANERLEVLSALTHAEIFRVEPPAQVQRSRSQSERVRVAAAVLVLGACLVATVVLVIGGSQDDDLGGHKSWEQGVPVNTVSSPNDALVRRRHGEPGNLLSELAGSLNFDYNPFGRSAESARHAPAGVGIRQIAHSSVNMPLEKGSCVLQHEYGFNREACADAARHY
jgi:hypothetical protein